MLKCTGGKGVHVTVPLAEKDDWAAVKTFASALAQEMGRGSFCLQRDDDESQTEWQDLHRLLP